MTAGVRVFRQATDHGGAPRPPADLRRGAIAPTRLPAVLLEAGPSENGEAIVVLRARRSLACACRPLLVRAVAAADAVVPHSRHAGWAGVKGGRVCAELD
jgi:hypothetical protein